MLILVKKRVGMEKGIENPIDSIVLFQRASSDLPW
jgi:hypothetical protein